MRFRRVLRHLAALLPFPTLRSDVRDVIYASWLVPLSGVAHLVPDGVTVRCRDGMTLLTVLTYRHGHFGLRWLGPLRRLSPSPLQSNWRLYVEEIDGHAPASATVLFLSNVFDNPIYVVATRLLSDSLPSHLAAAFSLNCENGRVDLAMDGGSGSAPSFALSAEPCDQPPPPEMADHLGDATVALAAICLQDAAIVAVGSGLVETRIDLPIDLSAVEPLAVTHFRPGAMLSAFGATHDPWCVRVPSVRFTVLGERLIR